MFWRMQKRSRSTHVFRDGEAESNEELAKVVVQPHQAL